MEIKETRLEREKRWYNQHKWDGPKVTIVSVEVLTCSRCGADESEQRPCDI